VNLTDAQKGYIAGIIDGEGCLQAHLYPKLVLRLEVGNTHPGLGEWLREVTGGGSVSAFDRGHGARRIHLWRAYSGTAAPLLREVLPYLIIKREQAEMFLELAEMAKGRVTLPAEAQAHREMLVGAIAANKREAF
jgi:hypothetical protein